MFFLYASTREYNAIVDYTHLYYKESFMKVRTSLTVFTVLLLVVCGISLAYAQKAADAPAAKEAVLKAADINDKLFPEKVFFRGQVASVQMRNTGGVRYADEFVVLAGLVDNSGYSSGLRDKYQGYLIVEVPVVIGGQSLKAGAYGFGFLESNKFVVMDVGSGDVLQTASTTDADLKRAVPLQVQATADAGKYRLYKGKEYVEFHRAK